MPQTIAERVRNWSQSAADGSQFLRASQQIEFFSEQLFVNYSPTTAAPHPRFLDRLRNWLDRAPVNDQPLLYRIVPHIFFVRREEFASLYRIAFLGPIFHWLIDQLNLMLDDPDLNNKLSDAIRQTWFCPITDSMPIADFCHVNNIRTVGDGYRPDWQSLNDLGDKNAIDAYITNHAIHRLVLLEDFVGSGTQMNTGVAAWSKLAGSLPLLVVPLIACPAASNRGELLANNSGGLLKYKPVLDLPSNTFVTPTATAGEDTLIPEIRALATRLAVQVQGGATEHWHGPFGYPSHQPTGGLIVMYSNCPDNSLPILHFASATWSPLFPRASRL